MLEIILQIMGFFLVDLYLMDQWCCCFSSYDNKYRSLLMAQSPQIKIESFHNCKNFSLSNSGIWIQEIKIWQSFKEPPIWMGELSQDDFVKLSECSKSNISPFVIDSNSKVLKIGFSELWNLTIFHKRIEKGF